MKKILIIFISVILIYTTTVTVTLYKVDAGYGAVLKTLSKSGVNVFKSFSKKTGKELDFEDFRKSDGSIDWDAYDDADFEIGNAFGKALSEGVADTTRELVAALHGDTSIITKTPLKGLPNWAKMTISTGAFITGADLLYEVYDYVSGVGASSNLESVGGKLVTITDNIGVATSLEKPQIRGNDEHNKNHGNSINIGGTWVPVLTQVNQYQSFNYYGWEIDVLTGFWGSNSMLETYVFIDREGYAAPVNTMVYYLDFKPKEFVFVFDRTYTTMKFYASNPSDNVAHFNVQGRMQKVNYGPSYNVKNLHDVIQSYGTRDGLKNEVYTPITNGIVKKVIDDIYAIKNTGGVVGTGGKQILIVPNGNVTTEEIQQMEETYPDIMRNPEQFLKDYPDFAPEETEEGDGEKEDGDLDPDDDSSWTVLGILKSIMKFIFGIGKWIIDFIIPDFEKIIEHATRLKDSANSAFPFIGQAREIVGILQYGDGTEESPNARSYNINEWEGIKANVPFVEEELVIVSPVFINKAGRTIKSFISVFMILMMVIYIVKRSDTFFKK